MSPPEPPKPPSLLPGEVAGEGAGWPRAESGPRGPHDAGLVLWPTLPRVSTECLCPPESVGGSPTPSGMAFGGALGGEIR